MSSSEKKSSQGDQYSEQEAQQRFEKLVKAALNTRPKPRKKKLRKAAKKST